MKRICQRCNVISQDFNLWCQETYCPAENATEIFTDGEWFGPIEIIQPMVVSRSAIIYHARRGEEEILLKIANVGCEEKLRFEAKAFLQLARAGQHPSLPVLLPAHPQGSIDNHPYGWTVINGRLKYYAVFKYEEGTILRNLLLNNPQPWFQHAGWIILAVLDVVYYLHRAGRLHLCINPDVIMVRFDKRGIPRTMLLDLGISSPGTNIYEIWNPNYNLPAYTAPEIADGRSGVNAATDVYGIGMLLYEMLAGRPALEYHLQKEDSVLRNVLAGQIKPTARIDLKNIPQIAEQAVSRRMDQRFKDVLSLAQALQPNFPPIPAERKGFKVNWRLVFIVLGTLLAVSLLVLLAFSNVP